MIVEQWMVSSITPKTSSSGAVHTSEQIALAQTGFGRRVSAYELIYTCCPAKGPLERARGGAHAALAGMAGRSFFFEALHRPVIDAGMHREGILGQREQVNVLVQTEAPGVFAEEGHQAHCPGQPLARKSVVVKFLRPVRGLLSWIGAWVAGSVESPHGSLVNGNMVRMAVAADSVES